MSVSQQIISKTKELSEVEFSYSTTSDYSYINALDDNCSGIDMDAIVVYFEIKNPQFLLKTGKRLAARVYKMYYHALKEICKESGGYFNCYAPNSFLMIYPKQQHNVSYVVDTALKIVDLLIFKLRETFEKTGHIGFSMGIDTGNILGTKTVCENNQLQITWYGTAINKAITIAQLCQRPFFLGLSGSVFHHLDDSLRTTTKHILGIKKQVDIWERVSYQFENSRKHLYQTNFHKDIDEEQPDN